MRTSSPAPARAAVIAIGSNSTRLLVANLEEGLRQPLRGRVETRLFLALDERQGFDNLALRGLVEGVQALKAQALAAGASRIDLVATAAVRDSRDEAGLRDLLRAGTGLELKVLSGAQEARYAFLGAAHPYLQAGRLGVIDIGGGSTELALGQGQALEDSCSLQLGASRLYASQPINSPQDLKAAQALVARQLAAQPPWPAPPPARWLLVGGTGAALLYLSRGSFDVDPHLDHPVSQAQAWRALHQLAALDARERTRLPGMMPGREHILPTGLVILVALMDRLGIQEVLVTHRNNCDGYLYGILLEAHENTGRDP